MAAQTNLDLLSQFRAKQKALFNPASAIMESSPTGGGMMPPTRQAKPLAPTPKAPAAPVTPPEEKSSLPQTPFLQNIFSSGRQAQRTQETGLQALSDNQIKVAAAEMRKHNPEITDEEIAHNLVIFDKQLADEQNAPKPQAPEKSAFADQHPDEGVVEQTVKAPFRAIGDFASQAKENVKNLGLGASSLILRGVNELNKVSDPLLGSENYQPGLNEDIQKTTGSTGFVGDIARSGQAATGLMSQYYAPGVNIGFNAAGETPGIRLVPQALNKGLDVAATGISNATGIEKGTVSAGLGTGLNTLMVKGGMKSGGTAPELIQKAKAAASTAETAPGAIAKGGLSLVRNIGKTAGETVKETAKIPVELAKKGYEGALKLKEAAKGLQNPAAEIIAPNLNKIGKKSFEAVRDATGMTPKQFALQENISTSDAANQAKIKYMDEKIDAVKNFGDTQVTGVEKRMASAIRDHLQGVVDKFSEGMTPEEVQQTHGEQMKVIGAMDKIASSKTVPFASLEALKSLYDYYNPDNIKWENGKPVSNAENDAAVAQRSILQKKVEKAGVDNGVDIAKMNKKIQAAHAMESGLDRLEGNAERSNLVNFNDTQVALLASIIDGGAGAIGSLLLKKGLLENAPLRFKLASKLYNPDVTSNSMNPVSNNAPISRVGRILGNIPSDSAPQTQEPALKLKVKK